ncbi:MAG: proteasome ATPase [Deltaproteobacteria bacterium]|nr:proteasome ATPase [Deltaproteobacteria bacterium]
MSDTGSGSGSGRRGFVRDVMKRISVSRGADDERESRVPDEMDEIEKVRDSLRFLGPESADLARRVEHLLMEYELLRQRIDRQRQQVFDSERQNEKLVGALQDAKQQIDLLKQEVDKLCSPPNTYGIFERSNKDGTCEINVDGKMMRVNSHPSIHVEELMEGQLVVLNEAFNIVDATTFDPRGEVMTVSDVLDDGRVIVLGHADEERVVSLAQPMRREKLKAGDNLLVNPRTGFGVERLPKSTVDQVMLEEVPDVTYEDIGGLGDQIEVLRDAIELPYLHADRFKRYNLSPPKGILLYGPPGCGKTMIGKAVANSLALRIQEMRGGEAKSYFLNVKGPELLNKYVGETEHKIREVFKNAREKAEEDVPVVIFFDEMDSLFRMRGSGISSDMEATVVAQFLSEIDGIESLRNVIVIGASNRQDLIDPAVLRPGRLDLKVKVHRPEKAGALQIFTKYLTTDLPFSQDATRKYGPEPKEIVRGILSETVESMYAENEENKFLEVTYAKGEREIFYFKDFSSGAMLKNIVDRAKKKAVKRAITSDDEGVRLSDMLESVREEFKENEDLPNTTNPDDWARISGRKGERIINVRTLITGMSRTEHQIENVGGSGQYL